MNTLHRVDSADIQRLQPGQLTSLLNILLHAKAKPGNAQVLVPDQIMVADDGEDGRWEGATSAPEYIPAEFTLYQSKAENLGPAQCAAELFAKPGVLKGAIKEVLQRKGAYVFFCGHGLTQKQIKLRLEKATAALKGVRKVGKFNPLHFLDGNKIAAWANRHVAAVAYVAKCGQLAVASSYRTWSDWSRDPLFASRFHSNPKLDGFITQLREHLLPPKNIARITGFSGLGKTRLGFEALRPPGPGTDLPRAILSYSCAYLDAAHTRDPLAVVNDLESAQMRGLVIVDNCVRSLHYELAKIIGRTDCQLSLLTMDYEPESAMTGALHVQLEPAMMEDIIPRILKELPQATKLSEQQLTHIAGFAAGFPQIAVLMAEAGDTLDYQALNDRKLAERILWGHGPPVEKAHDVVTALALFANVGFDKPKDGQKKFVREVLCRQHQLDATEFNRMLKPFERRRIVQAAGSYRFVAPVPLAVALAAEWWDHADGDDVNALLPQIEAAGLTEAFSRRIKDLHFSLNATAIAAQMVGATGPLGSAEVLNSELGSQLFRAIVELNPAAATACLWRAYGNVAADVLREVHSGRRNLVWALEKLCWERTLFPQAATLMLRFAAAENETWANNATGQFRQLFQVYLPGTEASLAERLPVIEAGLASGDAATRRVCIGALATGLKHTHFMRSGGVEVRGSGLPRRDYEPKTNQEIFDYWHRCFLLLAGVAMDHSPESPVALAELGTNLRALIRAPLLTKVEPTIREIAEATEHYWPEALGTLNSIFEFEKDKLSPVLLARLQKWASWLAPTELSKRLALLVTNAAFEHEKDAHGHYIDVSARKAEELAQEFVDRGYDLAPYLDAVQTGQQRQAFVFGMRLGQRTLDSRRLIGECLDSLRRIPAEARDSQLLAGVLFGLSDRALVAETLDRVAADAALRDLLVGLTRRPQPEVADLERILTLIRQGTLPAWQLRHLATGSCLDHLAPAVMIATFRTLALEHAPARVPVFEIFSMYVFRSEERWKACRDFLRELVMLPEFSFGLEGTMDGHRWQDASIKLLHEQRDEALAAELTRQILAAQKDSRVRMSGDMYRRPVLIELLKSYATVSWPLLGAELLGENHYQYQWLMEGIGFEEEGPSVLWNLPSEILAKWAAENPGGRTRLGDMMNLFTIEKDGSYRWHPTALALFGGGVDEEFTRAMRRKLLSFGSVGSRVPYVERRIALLNLLKDHPQPSVRQMASNVIALLEEVRAQEQKRDEESAARGVQKLERRLPPVGEESSGFR